MRDSPLCLARYLLPLNRFRFRSSAAFCLRFASYFCLSTFCFAFDSALPAVHFGHGRGRNQLISLSKFETNLIDSTTVSQSPLSLSLSLSHSLFIWLFSLVTTNCVNCSPHLHLLHICPHQISRNRSYHNQIFLNIPYQENEKRFGCHVIAAARGDQQGAEYEAHRLSVSLSSQSLLKLPPSHCLFVFVIFYCRKASKPGLVPLYIFECAAKLKMKPLTAACAAIVFHRFFKEVKASDYDEFVSSRRGSNRTGLRFLT